MGIDTEGTTWEGGIIKRDARGRPVFFIRKQINGKRYFVSTRAHSRRPAIDHLKRFEADPEAYRPEGKPAREPIYIDKELTTPFLAWSLNDAHNTPAWVAQQKLYLSWWGDELNGVDLRRATLRDDILPPLQGATCRPQKIAVIKRLYSWLRKERRILDLTEDPTFEQLAVPQARPEQWKRDKAIPREHYDLAREHLVGHWRDALDVLAGTGWHVTEVVRFAERGTIEPYPATGVEGVAGVLVCPQTKSGELLRTAVSQLVVDAATRLRERGSLSPEKFRAAIEKACKACDPAIPVFTPGRFRHSIATWAVNNGADPAMVSAFLGHKSPRTTRKFYATHATARKIPTLA